MSDHFPSERLISFAGIPTECEEYVALAERTVLVRNSSSRPMETRCSNLALRTDGEGQPIGNPDDLFSLVIRCPAAGYDREGLSIDAGATVIRNFTKDLDAPGAEWIALDPAFGRHMGWTRNHEVPFGWTDSEGSLTAWTMWWRDGNPEDLSYDNEGECGQGWLVLTSLPALAEIKSRVPELRRRFCIHRQMRQGESELSRIHVAWNRDQK